MFRWADNEDDEDGNGGDVKVKMELVEADVPLIAKPTTTFPIQPQKPLTASAAASKTLLTGFYGKVARESRPEVIERELRAMATEAIVTKTLTFDETMEHIRQKANEIAAEAATMTSKAPTSIHRLAKLVREAMDATLEIRTQVTEHEEQYRVLRQALLSSVKQEWINVPATTRPAKRMAVYPCEFGDVKRKRPRAKGGTSSSSATAANNNNASTNGKGDSATASGRKKKKGDASSRAQEGTGKKTSRSAGAAAVAAERIQKMNKIKERAKVAAVAAEKTAAAALPRE